jgi:hypothetical protein
MEELYLSVMKKRRECGIVRKEPEQEKKWTGFSR